MLDDSMRNVKDTVIHPLVSGFCRLGVSPTAVTALGFVVGLGAAAAAAAAFWILAASLWLVNRVLDGIDGALARWCGLEGDLGGYLDLMADFTVYTALPLGIAVGISGILPWAGAGEPGQAVFMGETVWPATAFVLGAFYINSASWMYLAAILEKRQTASPHVTAVVMPKGFIEGTETIIFFMAVLIFPQFAPLLLWLFGLCVMVSGVLRVRWWIKCTSKA